MKYVIKDTTLTAIGDAVREKTGTADKIPVSDIPASILAIETGGGSGGAEIPDEAFAFSGNVADMLCRNQWQYFIENYADKFTFNDITGMEYLFYQSDKFVHLPFEINLSDDTNYSFTIAMAFAYCKSLKTIPTIKGSLPIPTANYTKNPSMMSLFSQCNSLEEIPYDWFNNFISEEFAQAAANFTGSRANLFQDCYCLRALPDLSRLKTIATSSSSFYSSTFRSNYCLSEITNCPVILANTTSNVFSATFNSCGRLKKLTFETNNDGSPIVANWSKQTIDLSTGVGYFYSSTYVNQVMALTDYIKWENIIDSDEEYENLKDKEDSWTNLERYSRYNHDSAVETINSLPDVSSGSSNVIKFKGICGSATDGGAINTLTEEEIAVAAAKGWTVSLTQEAQRDEDNKF